MRKGLAVMLSALLVAGTLSAAPAHATEQAIGVLPMTTPVASNTIGLQTGTELVVGITTRMSGAFSTDMWGANTSDIDVRALLHGYETVSLSADGSESQFNSTVIKSAVLEEKDGDSVYTLTLNDDLTFSDGSPITAMDYVFSLLLSCAPEVAEIGGTPQGLHHLKGYTEYQAEQSEVFSGIRLLSETEFQLTILGEYLPFFYGIALLEVQPYPIAVIAPGCEVRDDGEGAYIATREDAELVDGELPVFSAEMLEKTMLDPKDGYLYFPRVTSGPYTLDSYDATNNVVRLFVNPYFKGDALRQTPHIEQLEIRLVEKENTLAQLSSGTLGLVSKVLDDSIIEPALENAAASQLRIGSYARSGLAFLAFSCEQEPTNSLAVRKAIMMAVDKNAIVANSSQATSAIRVEGYYGLGQWMPSYTDRGDSQKESLSIPEKLSELRVENDIAAAQALLEEDGWALNEKGEPFDAAKDTVRYRERNGALEKLTLSVAVSEQLLTAKAVCNELERALPLLGIELEIAEMPFPQLLSHYYRQTDRTYSMFFMATNFNDLFDPYYYFHTDDAYQGMLNTSGLRDEMLMELALDMRSTDAEDLRTYAEKWLAFQQRFVEMAPMVPLYSNVYYDLYRKDLQGYATSASWAQAIPYAYISDVPLLGEDAGE